MLAQSGMVRFRFIGCAGLLGLVVLLPRPAIAAWPTDPLVNVPLCTATRDQQMPTIVSDGAGGAIVTWYDYRDSNEPDIYAQRISAGGMPLWAAGGVALCIAIGSQAIPTITSDGAGGAIVVWQDSRNGYLDVYAQRISANGVVQWEPDGVALSTATGHQYTPNIVSDGAGGAVVIWSDQRVGSGQDDIYAQRISAGGTVQWDLDGVALCTAAGRQQYPTIVSDGAGGAIVAWQDGRNPSYTSTYAQKISATGAVQWVADGALVSTDPGGQTNPTIVSDGAGGAIVTWMDYRRGFANLFTQRISAGGVVQWTTNGVAVCVAAGYQYYPNVISDGASGVIITWYDYRFSNWDIYAQRVSSTGTVLWSAPGVVICPYYEDQQYPTIVSDGAGGAIITWTDNRLGVSNADIYAQRISPAGVSQWTTYGVALCTATGNQTYPTIVSDGAGGAIVTWHDYRSATNNADIYAQWVQANGQLGGSRVSVPGQVALTFALDPVRPNPSREAALMVHFTLPNAAAASLELLDVTGRRIASREVGSLGAGRHALDLGGATRRAPGVYLVRLEAEGRVLTRSLITIR